jgi:starch synthase (maltosyl-transferring)
MASAKRPAPAESQAASASGDTATGGIAPGDGTAAIAEGRVRAVIDAILPTVDGGRFPAKRIAGESVAIEAHCFTDGHDKLRVVLK